MRGSDLKYLAAYIIPTFAIVAMYYRGWTTWLPVWFTFGILPLIEQFWPQNQNKRSVEEVYQKGNMRLFDYLLYINIFVVFGCLLLFIWTLQGTELNSRETAGLVFSVGIVFGVNGINVGHELGHRSNTFDQTLGKLLLLPSLYMHFNIEHNRGHHKHVATDLDPSSAKKNEHLYQFWIRSVIGVYVKAWKLEGERLAKLKKGYISLANEMLIFQLIQILYLGLIYLFAGPRILVLSVIAGIIGFLLLETINYIEHYGLRRTKLPNGRYERVLPQHSWNSDFEMGRIFLYELTRHSDHHYLASKKYQILESHRDSPQLPYGYPASMVLALFPPLWFRLINPRLERFHEVGTVN